MEQAVAESLDPSPRRLLAVLLERLVWQKGAAMLPESVPIRQALNGREPQVEQEAQ